MPRFEVPDYVAPEHRGAVAQEFADRAQALRNLALEGSRVSITAGMLVGTLVEHIDRTIAAQRVMLPSSSDRDYGQQVIALHRRHRNLLARAEADVRTWLQSVLDWIDAERIS